MRASLNLLKFSFAIFEHVLDKKTIKEGRSIDEFYGNGIIFKGELTLT